LFNKGFDFKQLTVSMLKQAFSDGWQRVSCQQRKHFMIELDFD